MAIVDHKSAIKTVYTALTIKTIRLIRCLGRIFFMLRYLNER